MFESKPQNFIIPTGWSIGDWAWCLQCERVYQIGDVRENGDQSICPNPDCDGHTAFDSFPWESVAEEIGCEAIPQRGVEYPLNGRKNEN